MRISANFDRAAVKLTRLITRYAARVARDLDELIEEHAFILANEIIQTWPVDTGYSRSGWSVPTRVAYAHYRVVNPVAYAIVIEYGGYPGPGPKTARQSAQTLPGNVRVNTGIFPTQKPHAPVRRALSKQIVALRQDIEQLAQAKQIE